ncbi:MAG: carboxypeptidase regulatory-like domain-containing protein [Bryobacteraceae bacterium]
MKSVSTSGVVRLAATALLFLYAAAAQDPRGAIAGQITDETGAAVPGVSVRFTHIDTNVASTATSNEQGLYEMPYLSIGQYRVSVEHSGFKSFSRSDIQVRIRARVQLDIRLEVGNITESVDVTAQAPVLESTTGSIAQVIDGKQFSDMPLRSGSIAWLYAMSPGTVLRSLPYDGPWNIAQSSAMAVAGTSGVDFNVDGVSNNSYGGQTAFVPPPDMVQEVRVSTTSFDASIGHTSGASVDVSLKSGTNALHGVLTTSVSSGPMMTRNFFTNGFIFNPSTGPVTPKKIKDNTPSLRWLRYSAAVGGPVYIPKLYDGRNKTFWMFGYQSHNRRRPVNTTNTVPTEQQRTGDFSALLARGPAYQIYDPFSTRPSGASRFQRTPLPNNIVPANRIDAISRNLLKYYPLPNAAGTPDFTNNYSRTRQDTQDLYQPVARIDHNFSESHRMFARYSQSDFFGHFDELVAGSTVRGRGRQRPHRGFALDNVFVLNPSMVLDVRYGFTWFKEFQTFDNIGWDLTEFGLPASLISQLDPNGISFPQISTTGLLQLGNDGGFATRNYSHSLVGTMNWTRANHSIKYGFDGRILYDTSKTYGNVAPALQFGPDFTRGPLDNSPVAPNGQSFAQFLYGTPTGGGIDLNDSRAESTRFYSLFFQDDWRATRTLTLNLGLRWEYEGPLTERFNRSSRDFDFSVASPIQSQARAAYAAAPLPELPASQFNTTGGITFLNQGGLPRGIRDPYYPTFMPRLGFAWQPKRNLVVRGGYGIYYALLGAEFDDVAQPGFNQRTAVVPSLDNGQTYIASISNPLPAGLNQPLGAAGGLRTFLGRRPGFFASDGRRPYNQRWSYSIQIEPMAQTVVELGYIGNRGTRLRVNREFNAVPRELLSTSPVRDQPTIDFLSARASNPFRGIEGFEGTAFFAGANTTRAQLVRPYPHFTSLITALPAGASWYHAFTARLERRLHKGFLFQANYTWSKTLEALAYLNDTDSIPSHVASDIDRPHRFTLSALYEIPFLKQNRFLGGWQVQAIYQAQSGAPLAFGNVIYNGTYDQLRLSGSAQSNQRWFNTAGFETNPRAQLQDNIRNFPLRIAAARADGINVWDMSVHKNFRIFERLTAQLRGEAEGAMNHPNFSAPNTNPASTLFGQVTATQTGQEERRIFVTLKLIF